MPLTGELAEIMGFHKLLRMKLLRLITPSLGIMMGFSKVDVDSFIEELGCELQQPSSLGGICLEVDRR